MREVWNSLLIAFSMYSKVPVPQADWSEKNRRFVLGFFPLVGVLITALEWGWFLLAVKIGAGTLLRAGVAVFLPVLVTGGIHVDGFLDVCDASSSHREREEKLRILKDPHVGAFAVISGICFFLLSFALATEVTALTAPALFLVFPLSRCLSGLAVLNLKSANPKGTAAAMAPKAARRAVSVILILAVVAIFIRLFVYSPAAAFAVLAACAVSALLLLWNVVKGFGGINGDIAGHFLCVTEWLALLACVIVEFTIRRGL